MKFIGGITGISAYREPPEEYSPERPPPIQDVINLIRATYQFASFPILGPGVSLNGPFTFAGGRFIDGSASFGISQLIMLTGGDIVATASTSDSDLVLEHLFSLMDQNFGYRLRATAHKKKSYLSSMVVEFDESISRYIDKLTRIEELLEPFRALDDPYRLQFKSLTFGGDTSAGVDYLVQIERADFTIERRAEQTNPNRYFCTAPMTTEDHQRILRQIEEIAQVS